MSRARIHRCRSGAILLEVVLALAIFVAAALVTLSAMGQAGDDLQAMRDRVRAADLARSVMAKLEAGIGDTVTLSGPVPAWEDDQSTGSAFADSLPPLTGWEIKIDAEPAALEGLTRVTVTATRKPADSARDSDSSAPSYTLHQLVRLSPKADDRSGAESDAARRSREGSRLAPVRPIGTPKPAAPKKGGAP